MRHPSCDVVSIGADPHRDYELLLRVAATMPETSFVVVTTAEHARALPPSPANVTVETDLPFGEMRRRLASARVVALPVRENSYSGATTVLLQAMASGKPVVVTQTRAIASGYTWSTARTAGSCRRAMRQRSRSALREALQDEAGSQASGPGARDRGARAQLEPLCGTDRDACAGRSRDAAPLR